jgi:hypothetical protein
VEPRAHGGGLRHALRRSRQRQEETNMRWKDKPHGVSITLLEIHVFAHIDRNMLLGNVALIRRIE